MTHSNAHLYLPFVQAMANKKTVQRLYGVEWRDMAAVSFDDPPECYRVKPEPPKPREFWIVEYSSAVRTVHADKITSANKIIHVREVLPEDAK